MAILDPELIRQLSTSSGDAHVEAVVRLRSEPGEPAVPPEETERLAKELVRRAQQVSGEREEAFNIFRYLGSFAISATPAFLKTLLAQPEVAAALANTPSAGGMIRPVEKRPANIEQVARKPGTRPASSRGRSARTARRSKTREAR